MHHSAQTTLNLHLLTFFYCWVLILDVDSNPLSADGVCDLFHSNHYKRTGQLFWGDLWGSRSHVWGQSGKISWKIFQFLTAWAFPSAIHWNFAQVQLFMSKYYFHSKVYPYDTREMESGQLLFNKQKHLDVLNVLFFMNLLPFVSSFFYQL